LSDCFDFNYNCGVDLYRAHFPEQGQYRVVKEASPCYVVHPDVLVRFHWVLPHALLVVLSTFVRLRYRLSENPAHRSPATALSSRDRGAESQYRPS
jgi:hypothetical protein